MRLNTTILAVAASAVAVTGAATSAYADTPDRVSVAVRHNDLNLGSPEGRALLQARIVNAARRACQMSGNQTLSELQRSRTCYRQAMAGAEAQVVRFAG